MKRDLRKYAQQTNVRLFIGFLIIVLLIGDGLIYYAYGKIAAVTGLLCIIGGIFPLVFIWLAMKTIEWITKLANDR